MRNANIASLIFLFIETSFESKKFFATCCVIVEAPSSLLFCEILLIFFITALKIPLASIPGWLKKFYLQPIEMNLLLYRVLTQRV